MMSNIYQSQLQNQLQQQQYTQQQGFSWRRPFDVGEYHIELIERDE